MKKKISKKWLYLVGVIIMMGCNSSKNVTTVTPSVEKDSLKCFEQSMRENIQVSDSAFFYNSIEIQIKKVPGEEYNYVQDGIIYSVDFNKVEKSIPPLVLFYAIKMVKQKGTNNIIATVNSTTKNNVEYILNYYRKDTQPEYEIINGQKTKIDPLYPKTFILSSNANIRYKGKLFNIEVSAVAPCYLLVDYRRISENAESTEEWKKYQFVPSLQ